MFFSKQKYSKKKVHSAVINGFTFIIVVSDPNNGFLRHYKSMDEFWFNIHTTKIYLFIYFVYGRGEFPSGIEGFVSLSSSYIPQ